MFWYEHTVGPVLDTISKSVGMWTDVVSTNPQSQGGLSSAGIQLP